jgi:hypothetical protein
MEKYVREVNRKLAKNGVDFSQKIAQAKGEDTILL